MSVRCALSLRHTRISVAVAVSSFKLKVKKIDNISSICLLLWDALCPNIYVSMERNNAPECGQEGDRFRLTERPQQSFPAGVNIFLGPSRLDDTA